MIHIIQGFVVNKEALVQLRIRLEKIEQSWENYNNVQEKIEALDNSEEFVNKQQRGRLEFEKNYFALVGRARLIIEEQTGHD